MVIYPWLRNQEPDVMVLVVLVNLAVNGTDWPWIAVAIILCPGENVFVGAAKELALNIEWNIEWSYIELSMEETVSIACYFQNNYHKKMFCHW